MRAELARRGHRLAQKLDLHDRPASGCRTPTSRWPVRVQRCGTGTSCDCSPEHQLAAATNKIQRSASEEGAPLPNTVRRDMELAFSADFSAVRIHRSPAVDQATSALHARALTSGHDVLFRSGLFQPGTTSGNRLLAHELAHVIQQQKGSPGAAIDGGSTDPLEVAAEKAADQAVSGAAVTAVTNRATGRPTVQRKLEVRDPGGTPAGAPAGITNATIVDGYVKGICPDFTVTGGKMELTEMVDTPGLQPRRRPRDRAAAAPDRQPTPSDPAPC
jgi:hypothetical protein